jgi:hypothetical protein
MDKINNNQNFHNKNSINVVDKSNQININLNLNFKKKRAGTLIIGKTDLIQTFANK